MNTISRTITGTVLIALGGFIIILALAGAPWLLIYGLPGFIIGLFILFNKEEDQIEQIKKSKKK